MCIGSDCVMRLAVRMGDDQAALLNQYLPQLAELTVGNIHAAENMVLRQLSLSQLPDSVQQIIGCGFHKIHLPLFFLQFVLLHAAI
mgnify:CR=1 FL=1